MKKLFKFLLFSTVVAMLSIATLSAQKNSDVYGAAYRARVDSLIAADDWAGATETAMSAGRQAVADGAFKTATRFLSLAERTAAKGKLDEQLVEIHNAQWRVYDRRGNDKAALICLKRYLFMRDSLAVVAAQRAEAEALAAEAAAIEEAARQAEIDAEIERNKPNPFTIYYIIIGVAAALIVIGAVMWSQKRRRMRRTILALEKQCEIKSSAPLEIAVIAERVRRLSDDLVRNCRKEQFDLRTEIIPLLADSRALALTASNIVASYEENYTPEKVDVDVDKILKRAAKEFEPAANFKGVKIDYKSTGKTVVTADAHLIELAIDNLVSNAVKYSAKGKTVALWIETPDRRTIIGIEDKGAGIDAAKMEAMLCGDLFERTEGTAGETGLGLGVNVCRKAAAASSAEFNVATSAEGTTATFTFKS